MNFFALDRDGDAYKWEIDGVLVGQTADISPSFKFRVGVPHVVKLTVVENGISAEQEETIICGQAESVSAEFNINEIKSEGGETEYYFHAVDRNADTYNWRIEGNFEGNRVDLNKTLIFTSNKPSYDVTLIVTKGSLNDTVTKQVTGSGDIFTPDFSVEQLGDDPSGDLDFKFTAFEKNAHSYNWRIDGQAVGSGVSVSRILHFSEFKKSYQVQLTATKFGQSLTEVKIVEGVYTPPAPDATFSVLQLDQTPEGLCSYMLVPDYRNADTYNWELDGALIGSGLDYVITDLPFSENKPSYDIVLKVLENGQEASTSQQLTCQFETDGLAVTFDAHRIYSSADGTCTFDFRAHFTDADEYEWKIDGNLIGATMHVLGHVLDFNVKTEYTVELRMTYGLAKGFASKVITCGVDPTNPSDFIVTKLDGSEEGLCSFDFIATNQGLSSYLWKVDGKIVGSTEYVLGHTLDFTQQKTYIVELTVQIDGVTYTSQQEVECDHKGKEVDPNFSCQQIGEATREGFCTFEFTANQGGVEKYQWTTHGVVFAENTQTVRIAVDFRSGATQLAILKFEIDGVVYTSEKKVNCSIPTSSEKNFTATLFSQQETSCVFDLLADDIHGEVYNWYFNGVLFNSNRPDLRHQFDFSVLDQYEVKLEVTSHGTTTSADAQILTCGKKATVDPGLETPATAEKHEEGHFFIVGAIRDVDVYKVEFTADFEGESYRWELDGAYRARSRDPKLTIDFTAAETHKVSLTTVIAGKEYRSAITITEALVISYLNKS